MKRIHLVCNAHLDPVWLWRWEEGCTEALSTYRTAAALIGEFEGFAFNHNESLIYEWVRDNEPALYSEIKVLVEQGRWHMMGGWYLQPDCNMPTGESFVRNMLLGRRFFKEEFGKQPTTAINFDSFGHSKGLVQVLNLAGYDSYLVCRPAKNNFDFKDQDYLWKGFHGAQIVVHRSDENYNSVWGKVAAELEAFTKEVAHEPVSLFLWGVGDHGGGPAKKDLSDLAKSFAAAGQEVQYIHSTPEAYFAELAEKGNTLPIVDRGLNPVAQGCYTSQIRVKQKHRELENELYATEAMLSAAEIQYGLAYPTAKLEEAVRDMIFAEFHDALPGSGSQPVEEDTLRVLDHGLEIVAREKLRALIALSAGQSPVIDGMSSVMVYNPHPYDIEELVELEVGLPKQNWENVFYYPKVLLDGKALPTQSEKESSNFCIDWRKKAVVAIRLKASTMHKLDIAFEAIPKRPVFAPIISAPSFVFDNGEMQVCISTTTGLVDAYRVQGKDLLQKNSCALSFYDDTYNSWSIGKKDSHCKYPMHLLTPYAGSAFSGLSTVLPSVRVIEDGPVRTVVEAVFGCNESKAYQRYLLPKTGTSFDIETGVYCGEKDRYLKLELNPAIACKEFVGQVPFAHDTLELEQEVVGQKWAAVSDGVTMLATINSGTYGLSCTDGVLGLTLLRAAGYSAGDGKFENALSEQRYAPRMEQGERVFRFRIQGGEKATLLPTLHQKALCFNQRPYAVSFCPSGQGEKQVPVLQISNPAVLVSCLKKAERGEGYILRLYESSGNPSTTVVQSPLLGIHTEITLGGFAIATYRLTKGKLIQSPLLEDI